MAGVGAPHHLGDGVAAGRARSHIKWCLADQAVGAQHLPHVGLGAASALGVGGGLPGVRIYYDHRFESSGPAATRLEWLVELHGPLAPLIRPVFARVYGRNLDQGIPRLQEWFRH
jgi:hypothetical protein